MTAFSPGRVDLLLSVISFNDINYIIFVFQYGFAITSSMAQLHFAGGALTTTNWENSCAECVDPLIFSLPWRKLVFTWRMEPKCYHFCWHHMFLMVVNLTRMDSLKIVSNVFWTTNCLAPSPPPPSLPNWGHQWQLISWRDLILWIIHATPATQMIMESYRVTAIRISRL